MRFERASYRALSPSLRGAPTQSGRRSNLLAFSVKFSEIASLLLRLRLAVARNDAGRRVISSILIFLPLALIIAPEALAMSSPGYLLDRKVLAAGGSDSKPFRSNK